MGAQKNHLNEMVLLSNQNLFKLMGKKLIAILRSKFGLIPLFCFYRLYRPPVYGRQTVKECHLPQEAGLQDRDHAVVTVLYDSEFNMQIGPISVNI